MKRVIVFTSVLLMLMGALTSCSQKESKVIKVYGSGEVTYVPDKVTMTVKIRDVKPVMKDAVAHTNEINRKLLALCKEYNIPDEDVKTSYIQTGNEYEWRNGQENFVGYRSEQSVQITFKELDNMEAFTGDILALKVYSLGDFRYGHTKKSEFESEANLLALDDAKIAAEKMAERMNVKVGEVVYISDVNDSGYNVYSDYAYAASYDTLALNKSLNSSSGYSVAPGILSSTKKVVVIFEIK